MDIFVTYASDKGITTYPTEFKNLIFKTDENVIPLDLLMNKDFIRKHTGWHSTDYQKYEPCLISYNVLISMQDQWYVDCKSIERIKI